MNQITTTISRLGLGALAAFTLAFGAIALPADAAGPGIDGGLVSCEGISPEGLPIDNCDHPDDEEPPEVEEPEVEDATVDPIVVANPTFTG